MGNLREKAEKIEANWREFRRLWFHRRSRALIVVALGLYALASLWSKPIDEEGALADWLRSWGGDEIVTYLLYAAGTVPLVIAAVRIWREVKPARLPPEGDRPDAIKGPMPFTPEDGVLFRRLGREPELTKLLGYIQDDQIPLVVVMGESGAGKTSLLRAGLSNIAADKDIDYHYCEAMPKDPAGVLLEAIRKDWNDDGAPPPEFLNDLASADKTGAKHRVVVLDQFEQLSGRDMKTCPVFQLLRKVISETKPSHHITWIVAFRREFRADWSDFILEQECAFPQEMSLRLFSREQAQEAVSVLVEEAELRVEQRVIDKLLDAAIAEGRVSPVDIGIGMLLLSELAAQRGSETLTALDFKLAGGSEGLLTEYIRKKLEIFPELDRERLLIALLALCDLDKNQRLAEGQTVEELSKAGGTASRLASQLRHLASRSVRLLEADDQPTPRYRLPHERMVPALRRLTGLFLGEEQQARIRFDAAFDAWQNSEQKPQYLVRGKDRRVVVRHKDVLDLPKAKREFLQKSSDRHRLRVQLTAFSSVLVVTLLIGVWWYVAKAVKQENARRDLRTNGYPSDLYDWQHQLESLHLESQFNSSQLSWLGSRSLKELSLHPVGQSISDSDSANIPSLKSLELNLMVDGFADNEVSDLAFLEEFAKLNQLTLFAGDECGDLRPLAELNQLQQLTLNLGLNQAVEDLGPLAELNQLQQLTLLLGPNGKVNNLGPLAKLRQLRHLDLSSIETVEDLGPLAELDQLQQLSLDLSDNEKVNDLESLAKLDQLQQLTLQLGPNGKVEDLQQLKLNKLRRLTLDLSDCKEVDLRPLAELTHLNELSLTLSNQVKNLRSLAGITDLQQLTLHLGYNDIGDLAALTELDQLRQLTLYLTFGEKAEDLRPLESLCQLRQLTLDLSGTEVDDLGALANLKKLTGLTLTLGGSDVENLRPLRELTELEQLSLDLWTVKNLTPLENLEKLTRLSLNLGGEAHDLAPLRGLNQLRQLTLDLGYDDESGSRVIDLRPLEELPQLRQLSLILGNSQISGLVSLEKLAQLNQLTLDLNDSVSDLPALGELTQLKQLSLILRGSKVSDLSALANLTQLTHLELPSVEPATRLTLEIPKTLRHLKF